MTQMAPRLANPPLSEFLFEIKFKEADLFDADLIAGHLFYKLKEKFPTREPLKPAEIPSLLLPFQVQHRFRKAEAGYPLYQIGPGIVSFNIDGKTYNQSAKSCWGDFKVQLMDFIKTYRDALTDNFKQEHFEHFVLRAINKIEDANMYPALKTYLSEKLRLDVSMKFAEDFAYKDNLRDMKLTQAFNIDKEGNNRLVITISTITEGGKQILLDIMFVSKTPPDEVEAIEAWLGGAHDEIEKWFLAITENIQKLFG